jgi:hypothetical protein
MTALSTGALSQSPITNPKMFIPYVAVMEIKFPAGYGNRWERKFEIEKIANVAEQKLNDYLVANGYADESSKPVKFTIAFGNFVAKLTINGNVNRSRSQIPNKPTKDNTVINTGKGVVGYGCNTASNRVEDPYIVQFATILADSLDSIIPNAEVISLEVAGIRFGLRGRTF